MCHGKEQPLMRMKENDIIIYYLPTTVFKVADGLQSFTAIGRIVDSIVYPFKMAENFISFRRKVAFQKITCLAKIHPLIEQLEFITDKKHYGEKFRFGHFEIGKKDTITIWKKMN